MDSLITGLVLRRKLKHAGFTDDELRRLRARGDVVAVRRGAYVPAGDSRLGLPEARHALAAQAAAEQLGGDVVLSHASAAVLNGLPLWSVPLGRVNITRDQRSGGRRSDALHVHAATLDSDEIATVGGLAVTSVPRTVADLARILSFEQSVVIADAALHRGIPREDLLAAVDRAPGRSGNPAARRAIRFADGRAESPGESRSRVAIAQAGLPAPVLQWDVCAASGEQLGRVDFWWPRQRTVGEFDGRVKYGRLLRPGEDPGEVVYREKLREDALRDERLGMARWAWPELSRFGPVADRIRRAFTRA